MKKYRKKPVVIEAFQWTVNAEELPLTESCFMLGIAGPLTIMTLEGNMRAEIGDWIIKGVKGEFYPCKPDIFAMTYEEVEGNGG